MSLGFANLAVAEPEIDCNDLNDIKAYARCEVTQKWDSSQWSAFDYIITKESNWRPFVGNPNSSAFGLVQALTETHDLPHDYETNPRTQILWGIEYIQERYGTPSEAKKFHIKNNWY